MSAQSADLRRYVRWAAVLDALEQDIERVEKQIDSATSVGLRASLPNPQDLGPLPDGLTARAEELARRQKEVIIRGQERLGTVRRQMRAVQDMRTGTDPIPLYLDTTG